MSYCKNCEINYKAPLNKCMICGDDLTPDLDLKYHYQKHEKESKFKKNFLKAFILLNVISIFVNLTIDYLYNDKLFYSLIVSASNVYLILFLNLIFNHQSFVKKLFKSIFLSLIYLIAIALLIKDYNWAIDLVLPALLISNTLTLTIITIVKRKDWENYAIFLVLSTFVNIGIFLLNIFNVSETKWLITTSFFYGLSTLLGLIIFTPKEIKDEFLRRLHI